MRIADFNVCKNIMIIIIDNKRKNINSDDNNTTYNTQEKNTLAA